MPVSLPTVTASAQTRIPEVKIVMDAETKVPTIVSVKKTPQEIPSLPLGDDMYLPAAPNAQLKYSSLD
jgi:hypothetical protein